MKRDLWDTGYGIVDKELFTPSDINYLLEQQIIVMMNMVPNEDMNNSKQLLVSKKYDFLAPIEILQGNSLCDYMISSNTYIKNNIIKG